MNKNKNTYSITTCNICTDHKKPIQFSKCLDWNTFFIFIKTCKNDTNDEKKTAKRNFENV